MSDLTLCGVRLRSDLPLPELPAWSADNRAPEIVFRLDPRGAARDQSPALAETPFLRIAADKSATFDMPMLGRIAIRLGREAAVTPRANAPAPQMSSFLLGPALTLLCRQQGRVVLRAACVQTGDGAVVLAGKSRAGKSTLAAALALRGYRVLADDVCIVDVAKAPTVLPVASRVVLWQDSAIALGISVVGLISIRGDQDCYSIMFGADPLPSPLPLRAIYILTEARNAAAPTINALSDDAAAEAIRAQMRAEVFDAALGRQALRNNEARDIASHTPIFRLDYRHNLAAVNLLADTFAAGHAP